MRLFACTFLGSADRAFYDAMIRRLAGTHGRLLRPIPAESAHVTYAFIAHLDDVRVPVAVEALGEAAGRLEPVPLTIGAPQVLFGGREARLIHALIVSEGAALTRVANQLATALEAALPNAPLTGTRALHVTLARFRRGTSRGAAQPVVDMLARGEAPILRHTRFTNVQLVSSELTAEGPIYTVLASVALGEPAK
jgi:2'-5' RNA ligase